jgi:molybdate transport system substrate-binding protein
MPRQFFPLRPARIAVVVLAFLSLPGLRGEATVSVAAAASLVNALDALDAKFKNARPLIKVTATTGASGSLVAQIEHGAPFDVFLSADLDYPRAIISRGHAEAGSLTSFATGRLVLWTTRPGVKLDSIAGTVGHGSPGKLAIANPDTAPYGRAAQQALEKLGLWSGLQPKLVVGESITQAAQFVETGNADAGLVALSLVLAPNLRERGRWLEVPAELHAPLTHGAVLTKRGASNPAARQYLAFLSTEPAKKILREFGYGVP